MVRKVKYLTYIRPKVSNILRENICINCNFANVYILAPANPPDIVFLEGNCYEKDANLNWKVGALNNEEVYFFIIEWSTSYDPGRCEGLPRITIESATSKKLDFKLLPPYSQISFRLILANRIGNSKPSFPTEASDCITPPSGKVIFSFSFPLLASPSDLSLWPLLLTSPSDLSL